MSRPEPLVANRPIPLANLDPDAVKVVRRLVRYHHEAFLVGGCVRDLLLGCRPKDFDVATSARPPELRKLFRNCRIIGRRFRLAHMIFRGGKIIEVATFRREPQPSENSDDLLLRRDNVFGEPHEDALRRDFTINGLFYDVGRRQIIDYCDGLADVEKRLLRTIGDPDIRLQEDPVRMLRAIKFAARQDLGMAPELYRSAVHHRRLLARAASARVFEEILRLLRGGAAHRSFWLAREMGVLAEIIPELDSFLGREWSQSHRTYATLQALDTMAGRGRLPSDAVLLTALLEQTLRAAVADRKDQSRAIRDALSPIAERLVVPKKHREAIRQIMMAQGRFASATGKRKPGNRSKRGRRTPRGFFDDALDFFEMKQRAQGKSEEEVRYLCLELERTAPRSAGKRMPTRHGYRDGRRG